MEDHTYFQIFPPTKTVFEAVTLHSKGIVRPLPWRRAAQKDGISVCTQGRGSCHRTSGDQSAVKAVLAISGSSGRKYAIRKSNPTGLPVNVMAVGPER